MTATPDHIDIGDMRIWITEEEDTAVVEDEAPNSEGGGTR